MLKFFSGRFCLAIHCRGLPFLFFFLSIFAGDVFAARYATLVLPDGGKFVVDIDRPVYITRKINGVLYTTLLDVKTMKETPVRWDYKKNSKKYDDVIMQASQHYGVNPKLVHSVIKHESGYNPNAVSPKGAIGLMQLMPQTAKFLGVQNPYNPIENIYGGTKYLRYLLDMFRGDVIKTLAAYNSGEKNVVKYNGVPPFEETQLYVARVIDTFMR